MGAGGGIAAVHAGCRCCLSRRWGGCYEGAMILSAHHKWASPSYAAGTGHIFPLPRVHALLAGLLALLIRLTLLSRSLLHRNPPPTCRLEHIANAEVYI